MIKNGTSLCTNKRFSSSGATGAWKSEWARMNLYVIETISGFREDDAVSICTNPSVEICKTMCNMSSDLEPYLACS